MHITRRARPLKDRGLIWMIDNNPPAEGLQMDSMRIDPYGSNFKKRFLQNGQEQVILKDCFSESQLRAVLVLRRSHMVLSYRKEWKINSLPPLST